MALNSNSNSEKPHAAPLNFGTKDKKLDYLLETMVREVQDYAEEKIKHIQKLTSIGIALSAEKNLTKLLSMIVKEACHICNADAGTIYTMEQDEKSLKFEILQNDSLQFDDNKSPKSNIKLPNVPLYIEGKTNHTNVSSYVAHTGEIVNIENVYKTDKFNFSGTKKYDDLTGYTTKSMLVIPMRNHENHVIGILQLINAQDEKTREVIAFSDKDVDVISSLASQAAVSFTNALLMQSLKNLFFAFIKSLATALDEKSHYTANHIKRVVDLSLDIAEKINEAEEGPFKDTFLNDDELDELRIAAWMHDVGKVVTPEFVIDKSKKLEKFLDRIEIVELRFQLIIKELENRFLKQKVEALKVHSETDIDLTPFDQQLAKEINEIMNDLEFIKDCNKTGTLVPEQDIERVKEIGKKTYQMDGQTHPYLTENEIENLSIQNGTLTTEEREIIEKHAKMTYKITSTLPFPKNLKNVPSYASGHHEKLDGTGYPNGLHENEIFLQTRIMAIADIFEALTAKDRPYKKPLSLSQAISILGTMKDENHIDKDIYDLLIDTQLYSRYVARELDPKQIDMELRVIEEKVISIQ